MEVLSHECKIYAIHLLLSVKEPLYACEIMAAMGKKQYQISRCLTALVDAGLVDEEREGRFLLYSLNMKNAFNKAIFKGISEIDSNTNPELEENLKRLKKRVELRIDGKPSVTYCC
jgi:DNA-binding transcriptional ArsR family regulator